MILTFFLKILGHIGLLNAPEGLDKMFKISESPARPCRGHKCLATSFLKIKRLLLRWHTSERDNSRQLLSVQNISKSGGNS